MDWGLFSIGYQKSDPIKSFLRPTLMSGRKYRWIYHLCIVLDLILRFLFIISLLPEKSLESIFGPYIGVLFGSLEIIRRFVWGILRVEWEHIKLSMPVTESLPALDSNQSWFTKLWNDIYAGSMVTIPARYYPVAFEPDSHYAFEKSINIMLFKNYS